MPERLVVYLLYYSILVLPVLGYADWGYPEHNDVVTLGKHNHNQFLRDNEIAVILYTTPWCDHCKVLEKPYSSLGLYFKDHDDRLPLAKIDCSLNEEFCVHHLIPAYPFIKIFVRMHPIPYLGERKEDQLKVFIHDIVAKKPRELKTIVDLETVRKATKRQIMKSIAVFYGKKEQKEFHMFDLSCKVSSHFPCYFTQVPEVIDRIGLRQTLTNSSWGIVVLYKSGKKAIFHAGRITFDKVEDFMFHRKHPGLVMIGAKFQKKVIQGGNSALILFSNSTSDPIVKEFETATKLYRRSILCVLASLDQKDSSSVSRLIAALDVTTIPAIIFAENIHEYTFRRYKYKHILNNEGIGVFLRNIWEKKIDPDYKSEEVPMENNGPIRVLVGKEFRRVVRASGKQSVIFIRSDKCFDCEEMFRLYSKIQKKFGENPELQFLVMDGDKNEIPNFTWSSSPTLVIFPKRPQTSCQPFTGKWTEDNLSVFIEALEFIGNWQSDL